MGVEVKVLRDVARVNEVLAEENRRLLDEKGVFAVNLMGSPGSGKTSLIEAAVERLKHKYRIGVVEGDIATSIDAERVGKHGVKVVEVNTGGTCHLDAHLVRLALREFDLDNLDLLFIENVGNLVCPAFFNLGEHKSVLVLSTPEGDDKAAKYPVMFRRVDLLIVNKIDLLPLLDFSVDRLERDALAVNPRLKVLKTSCKTGEGIDEWVRWLEQQISLVKR